MTEQIKEGTICIWGPAGAGKTTDVASAFGQNAFWLLSEPDGLAAARSNLGYVPPHHTLSNLSDPLGELNEVVVGVAQPMIQSGQIGAVVLDTLTEFADRLLAREERFVRDARLAYGKTAMKLVELIRTFQLLGVWFVAIAHAAHPRDANGQHFRGGPALPGKSTPEKVSGMFSLILQAEVDSEGKRYVYRCDPYDQDYIMKDRYGCAALVQPNDLRPLLLRYLGQEEMISQLQPKKVRTVPVPEGYENLVKGSGQTSLKDMMGSKDSQEKE